MKRLERALEVATGALDALANLGGTSSVGNQIAQDILKQIYAILHPVEVEEIPVDRWMCEVCGEIYDMDPVVHGWKICGASLPEQEGECHNNTYVHLKGVRRREKKVVERSVSGPVRWEEVATGLFAPFADDGPYIQFKELNGKRGLLTFEWTE